MPNAPERFQWNAVQDAERAAIERRRGGPGEDGLTGLAISGGGIRSATFALGVLESLKDCELLAKFHYLSTVSGGGYIGSWLSANCRRRSDWLTSNWNQSISYLRRYSNYLSPQVGFFSADTWSMVTIWIRNTMLIQATVILAIACALLVPQPLYALFHWWPESGHFRWITVILFIFGISGIAGNHWQLTTGNLPPPAPGARRQWRAVDLLQAKYWPVGTALAAGFLAAAVLFIWLLDFNAFEVLDPAGITAAAAVKRGLTSAVIALLLILGGFCLQPLAVRIVAARFLRRTLGLSHATADLPTQVNYTQGYVQFCVVVPLMAVALLVTSVLWAQAVERTPVVVSPLGSFTTYSAIVTAAWKLWPFHLAIVFVSFWVLSVFAIANRREPTRILIALAAPLVAVPTLHALLSAIVLVFQWFHTYIGGEWMAFVWGPPFVAAAFVLSIVVLIGMLGRDSTEGVREWWSRLGAWLAIYAVAWMVIAVSAVYGPLWLAWLIKHATRSAITAAVGWAATVAGGLMAGNSSSTGGKTEGIGAKAKDILARVAPFVFIAGVLLLVAFVIHKVLVLNGGTEWWEVEGPPLTGAAFAMLAACVAATALLAARVDINDFSLNTFYRNRLVRCYLGATREPGERNPQNFTGFDDKDDIRLAFNSIELLNGPFHIVNCALNLGGSSDLALHTRHSASMTLSPLHCGSSYMSRDQHGHAEEIGYIPTGQFGHHTGGPTLGQAVSVSGAAASPNMGYHTSPVTAFLMTLFNVRLGWWFPNPLKAATGDMSPHFSLTYLGAELFGGASDKTKFVMVSDGGHFENLATYELIRRKCAVIVISDAECDLDYSFGGLGTLIRVCEVDFGCQISIDVDPLRPVGDQKWSQRRFAVGDITYDDGTTGILIYIKASMTGDEDTSVRQYKSSNIDFPHETTGDQFYGEDQFESYRHLGRDIGFEVFGPFAGTNTLAEVARRLHESETNRRPVNDSRCEVPMGASPQAGRLQADVPG
jgi:hypothetical protein